MIDINYERGIQLLRQAAQGRETFVYIKSEGYGYCAYVLDGKPSCLIGCALVLAGVPIERFDERVNTCRISATVIDDNNQELTVPEYLGVNLTHKALMLFSAAQGKQDNGMAWGDAIYYAISETSHIEESTE
ncbi:MAG TPA: hypothetical protein VHK27_03220 [Gammaproteobacteria bacterium]|nr:hypothetical protein [Gammaproteobacteria bacterium]